MLIKQVLGALIPDFHSPTTMCKAEVTGSFRPTVAKQTQSVEPIGKKGENVIDEFIFVLVTINNFSANLIISSKNKTKPEFLEGMNGPLAHGLECLKCF